MSLFAKFPKYFCSEHYIQENLKIINLSLRKHFSIQSKREDDEEEFRVLKILPPKQKQALKPTKQIPDGKPKSERRVTEDTDWTNFWTGPKSFMPESVPLPIVQGYRIKGPPCQKFGNAELMKIPNFLHLTPPAIEKHCNALKKFCTKWPEELQSEEDMEKHFPITITASDYCHSSPTIRDPLARIISLQVKLKNLKLDKHARDKFLRLVGKRYDPKTDCVTITTQSCPLKKQNYDYAMYILTALYYESWKKEPWEDNKSDEDMEEYIFEKREAQRKIDAYFAYNNRQLPNLEELVKTVEDYLTNGEKPDIVKKYKEDVMNVLGIPKYAETLP